MFDSPLVYKIIDLAIEEDLSGGDVTAELTVEASRKGRAEIVAKENLIVCGLPLIERIFARISAESVAVSLLVAEGARVRKGTPLASIKGSYRKLLSAERMILNFLQRLSGIATRVEKIVSYSRGITVLDSRKTTPGLRVLEKYAVRIGGGRNHRNNLSDMILVKNNHIDANGGNMRKTLERVWAQKPLYMPVEIEVRSIKELEEALQFSPTAILLDNMSDKEIARALKVVNGGAHKPLLEISGGVTVERLAGLKKLGVAIVSMGGLTTRSTNVDISMRIA